MKIKLLGYFMILSRLKNVSKMHQSLMIINDYTLIVLFKGEEVIGSDTKPPLHVINKRLRLILKIVRPYKDPLAAPKKRPT